ncbi:MAG: hypothetical protein LUH22_13700 [Bacteroides sp.]|nr:hypothetical protein [Bacteroides sp.]
MEKGIVTNKEFKQEYEPGSGSLFVPVLGNLFPKLFGQSMRSVDRWFVIAEVKDKLYRYEIDKKIYDRIDIGDKIEIRIDQYGMPEVGLMK